MDNKELEVVYIDIKSIKPYEKNPRKNDKSVPLVANSIKEFGFRVPITLDKDNVIVTGHTRYKAAKSLGMKKVPCIYADDLTPEQIQAFRLADNKVGEFSEWDLEFLPLELEGLADSFDMGDFGFNLDIEMPQELTVDTAEADKSFDSNNKAECTCPNCGLKFVPIME